ncbi:MAG: nitrilase-related carbon-nitrogen hydrolase, partial [Pseudomonadota bacterium]
MSRIVTVGAAQLGPIAKSEPRRAVVDRLIALLRDAKAHGCDLVAFPELALTTFFPRWFFENPADIDTFFEREMPSASTAPLFDEAKRLGIGFMLGFAELVREDGGDHRFNTSILVDKSG